MMRSILPVLLMPFLPFIAEASSQNLSCRFVGGSSADRVRITLLSPQDGTFLYETADSSGTGSTEAIRLKRISDPKPGTAAFEVQSSAVQMIFTVEASKLFRAGTGIEATLLSRIPEMDLSQEQPLLCDSNLGL
jgi:hypothetical protein